MSKNDETKANAPGPAPTPVGENTEARIAEQRLRDLEQQARDAIADAQKAKAEVAGLKGELERANTELAGLKASNERLESANRQLAESATARDGLPSLPVDLPKGAAQLTECVTIAVVGGDGKPVRATPKRGDVLVLSSSKAGVEDLQAEIGVVATVYAVDRSTLDELRALKAIR